MQVPEIRLLASSMGDQYVEFRTLCGSVVGTAHRQFGDRESHYDVAEAYLMEGPATHSISSAGTSPGSFNIVGKVIEHFEDGVFVVESHGFTFWLDDDDAPTGAEVGAHLSFRIVNFTLYV